VILNFEISDNVSIQEGCVMTNSMRKVLFITMAGFTVVAFQNCAPAFEVAPEAGPVTVSGSVVLPQSAPLTTLTGSAPSATQASSGTQSSSSTQTLPVIQPPTPIATTGSTAPSQAAPISISPPLVQVNPAVSMELEQPPQITRFPSDQIAPVGTAVDLAAVAAGSNLKFQWYIILDGESEWQPIIGATYPNLSFTMHIGNSVGLFRLVVSNEFGSDSRSVLISRP
jgi:hypothetical protein